jgi:ADP-ribosylglycohydrolase
VLRHYLCLAIIAAGGRVTPDDYARVWLERADPTRLFVTERIVLEKLKLGMNPWTTGRGLPAADAASMSIAPIGLINATDPAQAYQDAFIVASVHQDGFECEAAATLAAAVAAALAPRTTIEGVLETMRRYSSYEVRRLVVIATDVAAQSADADEFVERFYATMLDRSFPVPPGESWDKDRTNSPTSREVLPAVVGLLLLCGGKPTESLIEGASFGRDADTIATIVGGVTGALHGATSVRPDWIAQCEEANHAFLQATDRDERASFRGTADRLVIALAKQRDALRQRVTTLDSLL